MNTLAVHDTAHRLEGAIAQRLRADGPRYTTIHLARILERDEWAFAVEHAGERRRVVVDGYAVQRGGPPVMLDTARRAIQLAEYLDDLRQGMRDLIDQ